jgi:hypothetical protein
MVEPTLGRPLLVFEEDFRAGLAVFRGSARAWVVDAVYLHTIAGEMSLTAPTPATKKRPVWALVIWKVLAVAEVIAVQTEGTVLDAEATAEVQEYHW